MANGEVQNAPEIEEATDELGAPNPKEEQDEDWSPDDLNEEQRAQYERGVAAVDEFLSDERTKQYEPTDANREKLLAYLDEHDLPMSFGGLYVAFEQLSEANELELNRQPADEEPDASASQETLDRAADDRLATAGLARTRGEEEPPRSDESDREEEPIGRRGKPVAWRNGRAVIGVGS